MRHIFSVDRDVHTVEAGDEGGNHQDYGDRGHALHDGVHVVGNDGGECVHCTGQDIAIDIDREVRLFQFCFHIFHQFVVHIDRFLEDALQFGEHHFITTDGCVEVNHALFQLHQTKQVFITDTFFQRLFGMRHLVVDLFQVFQEPYGGRMDQTQNQVIFVTYDDLFAAGVSDISSVL